MTKNREKYCKYSNLNKGKGTPTSKLVFCCDAACSMPTTRGNMAHTPLRVDRPRNAHTYKHIHVHEILLLELFCPNFVAQRS